MADGQDPAGRPSFFRKPAPAGSPALPRQSAAPTAPAPPAASPPPAPPWPPESLPTPPAGSSPEIPGSGPLRRPLFHGTGGTLFGIHVVNTLLTLVTFGVYY
ncbi:MAG TPA: DUF898 family protein, partial [Pseudomonadales bacterium]|nr:DUF898 family protein [Pseudomonadales bacterium]